MKHTPFLCALLAGLMLGLGPCTNANQAQAAATGTWKNYMAYHDVTEVEKAGNMVYVLASANLYVYNTADNSLQTFDKVNGLSDCGIKHISYNNTAKKLLVLYENYNMDLITPKGIVTNLSDYATKNMTADKKVNDILQAGRYAYLSTTFGIVKVDMQQATISDTYMLGRNVLWTSSSGNYLYAHCYPDGDYRAALSTNLLDKANWSRCGNFSWKPTVDKSALLQQAATWNPGGPKYNYFGFMKFYQGSLYTCGGSYGLEEMGRPGTVQVLKEGQWQIYQDDIATITGHKYEDMDCLDIDPTKAGHVAVGGKTGLYEFQDGRLLKAWNNDNTNGQLQTANTLTNNNKNYVIVNTLKYDATGQLWVFNSRSPGSSLAVLDKAGVWQSKHNEALTYKRHSLDNMVGMTTDSRGWLWMGNNFWDAPSLYAYQPSTGTLNSYTSFVNEDGTTVTLGIGGGVTCVAEDLAQDLWIGTSAGPLLLPKEQMKATTPIFTQVKVPRNDGTNLADYLLDGIHITTIAVDGAGRKWMGTATNGVYLISQDNLSQVHHFTAENSPLLSNSIESIAIDSKSGEVFFGTDKGLCSYVSDATAPVSEMSKDVTYAYPNPVEPGYTGPITIVGLSYNADIKITTSNGVLVAQGRSNGGSFTWDGNDLRGHRVASGIYMVNTATQDGNQGTVCKIAIIN